MRLVLSAAIALVIFAQLDLLDQVSRSIQTLQSALGETKRQLDAANRSQPLTGDSGDPGPKRASHKRL